MVSDNGLQYSPQEFTDFARQYNFCHLTSSLLYPQSNGQAKRGVQTEKAQLKEADDPYMALLFSGVIYFLCHSIYGPSAGAVRP